MKLLKYVFFILVIISMAYPQVYHLHVNLSDGSRITYDIAEIRRIDFSGITSIEDGQKLTSILKSFKLSQNYPNPFNPSTCIEYEIYKPGKVEISIFDLNGRLINTLIQENQPPGRHKVIWDGLDKSGRKVVTGFYIYTINFDNLTLSKKMVLIK